MKLRILNYGLKAEHEQLIPLSNLFTNDAYNDFDALIFDPAVVANELRKVGSPSDDRTNTIDDYSGTKRSLLNRHSRETLELVWAKGGVVICVLRENIFELNAHYRTDYSRNPAHETYDSYFLLERLLKYGSKQKLVDSIVSGRGSQLKLVNGAISSYLRILKGQLYFAATFGSDDENLIDSVQATDSLGRIAAAGIRMGRGHLLFVPASKVDDPKRLGAALVQSVKELIAADEPDSKPSWVESISVPGAGSHDEEISNLRTQQAELAAKAEHLEKQRDELEKHRYLLYATGKHVLEPAVRRAFRVLGYDVSEPETYEGEWDIEMRDRQGSLLIGEVEGPEGAVDLDKFRQALDYHTDRTLTGDDNKGLLVGNAYRLTMPSERGEPFTEHAVRGAEKRGIALIPTPDLFKAVCDVLSNPSEGLILEIQSSISACSGVWKWPYDEQAKPEAA